MGLTVLGLPSLVEATGTPGVAGRRQLLGSAQLYAAVRAPGQGTRGHKGMRHLGPAVLDEIDSRGGTGAGLTRGRAREKAALAAKRACNVGILFFIAPRDQNGRYEVACSVLTGQEWPRSVTRKTKRRVGRQRKEKKKKKKKREKKINSFLQIRRNKLC